MNERCNAFVRADAAARGFTWIVSWSVVMDTAGKTYIFLNGEMSRDPLEGMTELRHHQFFRDEQSARRAFRSIAQAGTVYDACLHDVLEGAAA